MTAEGFEVQWFDTRRKERRKEVRPDRAAAFALAAALKVSGHSDIVYRRVGATFWKGIYE